MLGLPPRPPRFPYTTLFYHSARKAGVRPIIGCEFYITPAGMDDRSDRTRYHQVLLAKNETGYRNLMKLSSLSYMHGYYYKPRLDLDRKSTRLNSSHVAI